MILSRLTVSVGVAASALAVIAALRATRAPTASTHTFEAEEIHRIQIHFDSALALLDAGNARALSPEQRIHRAAAAKTLRAYRDRGIFPHNYDFVGLTPYFVDRKTGTPCAVAHLLESTGRSDIVARVARTNNNVLVRDLAGDTAFTDWLDENGLSLAEAAFIQVPYARPVNDAPLYGAAVGLVAMIPTATTAIWNLTSNTDGHRPWVNRIGLLSGLVAIGAGTQMRLTGDDATKVNGFANVTMAVGAAGTALAIHGMIHHSRVVAREREASRRAVSDASISPIVSADRSRTGMAVSFRF